LTCVRRGLAKQHGSNNSSVRRLNHKLAQLRDCDLKMMKTRTEVRDAHPCRMLAPFCGGFAARFVAKTLCASCALLSQLVSSIKSWDSIEMAKAVSQ
jgi:hypothetical protein